MAITNTTMPSQSGAQEIRSRSLPGCIVCGSLGKVLYIGLSDRLFGAPGNWTLKQCSREECGLAWLDPMPVEQDIHKAYANYHTHENAPVARESRLRRAYDFVKRGYLAHRYGYATRSAFFQKIFGVLLYLVPSRRAVVDAQVLFLHAKEGGSLLDVGCGNGQTLAWMAGLGWQVQGLDTDPVAVRVASSKGLKVNQGTLQSQQFAAESFDAIFMSHVIEHVHDPLSLLTECYRVLKPGGKLIVVTPNIRSWGHRLYTSYWRGLEPPRHLQIFARPSLLRLSASAGFASCECRAIIRGAGDILLASRALRKRKSAAASITGTLRIVAELVTFAEWVGNLLDHDAGEELVLVGNK